MTAGPASSTSAMSTGLPCTSGSTNHGTLSPTFNASRATPALSTRSIASARALRSLGLRAAQVVLRCCSSSSSRDIAYSSWGSGRRPLGGHAYGVETAGDVVDPDAEGACGGGQRTDGDGGDVSCGGRRHGAVTADERGGEEGLAGGADQHRPAQLEQFVQMA